MKQIFFWVIMALCCGARAQYSGKVISLENNQPLHGVSVLSEKGELLAKTDAEGIYKVDSYSGRLLVFSHLSHKRDSLVLSTLYQQPLVLLQPLFYQLNEAVVSTGYQNIRERQATGSFSYVGKDLINRSVSSDIISRLEAVTNSLLFIRKDVSGEQSQPPQLRIRGRSTLFGEGSPLIIMDNFPYEGDLASINPNDIESVSLLKDAASSAIWGARAGNGVIVITSKKGKYKQSPSFGFTSNFSVYNQPDLFYSPYFMSSADFIEVEKELFNRRFYAPADWEALSPAVEALYQNNNQALQALRTIDYRKQASDLFYRNETKQQYFMNFSGGGGNYGYYVSAGYDQNYSAMAGNSDRRFTLQSRFSFRPFKNAEFTLGHNFVSNQAAVNAVGITSMYASGKQALLPYTLFTHPDGSAAPLPRYYRQTYLDGTAQSGLLDWFYRPVDELRLNDNQNKASENRIFATLNYQLSPFLNLEAKYQYHHCFRQTFRNNSSQSFYARNMVNRFTQPDGTRIIPAGAIHEGSGYEIQDKSLRTQLNYDQVVFEQHAITAMAGAEIRETINSSNPGYILYGLEQDILVGQNALNYAAFFPVRPQGSAQIPGPIASQRLIMDRYLSYYGNFSYMYDDKYSLSFSARKDGANIYGIKTNQRFVPLWSAGIGWILSQEGFWPAHDAFLKIRATFGYSGNSFRSVTAFPTARYRTESSTGLVSAELTSPGNPSLSWEKVLTRNIGLDLGGFSGRIKASVDYYLKNGLDLIGDQISDPTTGLGFYATSGLVILTNRTNYANTKTRGLDIEVTTKNTTGKLLWTTTLLVNTARSTVTEYEGITDPNIFSYTATTGDIPPVKGSPTDPFYSIPWHGLSPDDGSVLVITDGKPSTEYGQYISQLKPADLVLSGSSVPKLSGSLRNTLEFGNLSLSAVFSWKTGYYFRASSINYHELFNAWLGHKDYSARWQKAGDELLTAVPSMPTAETYDPSARRDLVYTHSQVLARKGDHIRWNDLALNYTFSKARLKSLPASSLRLSVYIQNLGLLWSKTGIDPDYPNATYPPPTSFSLGLNANF